MLFLVFPHVWILQPMARAIPVTLALDAGITGISVARAGAHGQAWAGWVLVGGLSLFLALLLGIWISRVIAQSAQRAELIAELARTREQLESLGRGAGAAAERERMAAEIHDTLAQGFAGVLILLAAVEPLLVCDPPEAGRLLDQARSTVQQNLAEARALVAVQTLGSPSARRPVAGARRSRPPLPRRRTRRRP